MLVCEKIIFQADSAYSECQAVWDGSLGVTRMTASPIQVLVGVCGFGVEISFNLACRYQGSLVHPEREWWLKIPFARI